MNKTSPAQPSAAAKVVKKKRTFVKKNEEAAVEAIDQPVTPPTETAPTQPVQSTKENETDFTNKQLSNTGNLSPFGDLHVSHNRTAMFLSPSVPSEELPNSKIGSDFPSMRAGKENNNSLSGAFPFNPISDEKTAMYFSSKPLVEPSGYRRINENVEILTGYRFVDGDLDVGGARSYKAFEESLLVLNTQAALFGRPIERLCGGSVFYKDLKKDGYFGMNCAWGVNYWQDYARNILKKLAKSIKTLKKEAEDLKFKGKEIDQIASQAYMRGIHPGHLLNMYISHQQKDANAILRQLLNFIIAVRLAKIAGSSFYRGSIWKDVGVSEITSNLYNTSDKERFLFYVDCAIKDFEMMLKNIKFQHALALNQLNTARFECDMIVGCYRDYKNREASEAQKPPAPSAN